ncbi:PAS domain S-box protein [bacterium]|nr:PAS domain S-box protein [bacterium]
MTSFQTQTIADTDRQDCRILLVEDNPDDAIFIREILSPDLAFDVVWVTTLAKAAGILDHVTFAAALLDLSLPDSTGIDTVRRFHQAAPDLPVIVLTGMESETLGIESIQNGAQDYLQKGSAVRDFLPRAVRYAIQRAQMQITLKESEERYRDLFDNAGDLISLTTHDDRFLYVNRAWETALGFGTQELAAISMSDIIHPDDQGRWRDMRLKVWAGHGEGPFEIRFVPKRSGCVTVEAHLGLNLKRGRADAIRGIFMDITERKRMESMKEEFIGILSHELRSPLTVICGAIESLKPFDIPREPDRQMEFLGMIDRNAVRLNKTIENVLALTRLESGKALIHRRALDLAPLLSEAVVNAHGLSGGRPIRIDKDVPSDLPPCHADGEMVMQVLSNLLSNAMRFAKSAVWVKACADPDGVRISVIDDGDGIPGDRMGSLFDKFVQVSRSAGRSGEYKGTGLGLAICKLIVRAHKGDIRAENSPGKGAAFHVRLPVYDEGVALKEAFETLRNHPVGKVNPVSLILVTLERQESVEGAQVGGDADKILRLLEERLKDVLREQDRIVRTGQRIAILSDTDQQEAELICKRVIHKLKPTKRQKSDVTGPLVAVGRATYPDDGGNVSALLDAAARERRAILEIGTDPSP